MMVSCLRRNVVWIPAGVYPRESGGGNDDLRAFIYVAMYSRQKAVSSYQFRDIYQWPVSSQELEK
jgi:hypothetical protein